MRRVRRLAATVVDFGVSRDGASWRAPARPAVDFSRDVVVAVFRQGTGASLTIDGFETKSDRIVAHFTVRQAGPNCTITLDIERLYAFALLPRTDLPVESDERDIVVDCPR
jgi:hypothetical protein